MLMKVSGANQRETVQKMCTRSAGNHTEQGQPGASPLSSKPRSEVQTYSGSLKVSVDRQVFLVPFHVLDEMSTLPH